jgi:hypothetical protein
MSSIWQEIRRPEARILFTDVSCPRGFAVTGQAMDEDNAVLP